MGRRRVAIATFGGLLLLALAGVWWRARERAGDEGGARAPAAQVEAGDVRRGRRIDTATVARAAIDGTVRDEAGAPVAAHVCGQAASRDLAAEDVRDPVCVTSGADGRYRLSGLLPASYSVDAAAPGFIPASYRDASRRTRFDLGPGEERHDIDIVLQPGGVELAGVVNDIGGGPVEGAWVEATFAMSVALHATARARSLADGRFRLWVAPGYVMLIARADGYADSWSSARAPGQTVEILLTPESTLSGRVVQVGTGAPVSGARVASAGPGDWSPDSVGDLGSVALADDQGRFRLTRLPPGRYKPVARSARGYGQARESVLLGLGQSTGGLVIELHPATAVTGRVLVAGSEAPCPTSWVSLNDTKRERHLIEAIDRDGRIEIEGVLAGRYRVEIRCNEFLAEEEYPDVIVAAGEAQAEQRWTVSAGGRIRGTVRASEGAPVVNASVVAHPQAAQSNGLFGGGAAGVGADGRFELAGLAAGTYQVSVVAPDHPEMREPVLVTVSDGGDATVDIRFEAGGDMLGDVVDEKGRPVAGVTVVADAESSGGTGGHMVISGLGQSGRTETADDGSFALRGLRPGTYHLSAWNSRGSGATSLRSLGVRDDDGAGEKVEVTAGGAVRTRLVVESQSGVIRGRVVDARGGAITDALVDAELEPESGAGPSGVARETLRWVGSRRPIMTDTDGRFAMEKLSPGTYTVRAYRRGGGEALADGVAVGADIVMTIRPTGSIAGRVVSEGAVPEEITIVLADQQTGFSRRERFFRTAGEFALRDLPPGSFAVSVRAFEGTGDAEAVLAEGQNLTGLMVRMAGRATLTGRLVSLDQGKPVPGYQIEVTPHAPGRRLTMSFESGREPPITGQDGRFVVEDVPVGRVQVFARPPDFTEDSRYGFVRRIVDLQAASTTDLGDVRVAPIRVSQGEPGDLGFRLTPEAADLEQGEESLTVASVRPDGPAARSGLAVGDVIVSVDGHDVRGDQLSYWALSNVPPGTTVTFGLARGASVRITAGESR
jgi:protocatechuate 3,4-dioxygenase beta subunit